MRAALVYLTCFNLVAMPLARAESTSSVQGPGAPGSITIGTMDPLNPSRPISDKFHYGDRAKLDIRAYDANGVQVPCNNPTYEILNDYGSTQIEGIDANGIMTMGNGLGEPRVRVRCEGLASVGELHVYNSKKMVPHKFNKTAPGTPPLMQPLPNPLMAPATPSVGTQVETPPPAAAAAAGSDAGGAVLGALLGVGIAVGAAVLVMGATSSSSPCTPPELACGGRYDQGCCPAGYMYICKSPASVAGCYDDIFITGCTLKYFCGSDY